MASTSVTIRMDENLKKQAERLFEVSSQRRSSGKEKYLLKSPLTHFIAKQTKRG